MTIQVSVVIWTIICFLALFFILKNLLFAPVLAVIDARKARLNAAAQEKAERLQAKQERDAALALQEAEHNALLQKQVMEKIEQIRAESKQAVEDSKAERLEGIAQYRVKAEEIREEAVKNLSGHMNEFAVAFAERIIDSGK